MLVGMCVEEKKDREIWVFALEREVVAIQRIDGEDNDDGRYVDGSALVGLHKDLINVEHRWHQLYLLYFLEHRRHHQGRHLCCCCFTYVPFYYYCFLYLMQSEQKHLSVSSKQVQLSILHFAWVEEPEESLSTLPCMCMKMKIKWMSENGESADVLWKKYAYLPFSISYRVRLCLLLITGNTT